MQHWRYHGSLCKQGQYEVYLSWHPPNVDGLESLDLVHHLPVIHHIVKYSDHMEDKVNKQYLRKHIPSLGDSESYKNLDFQYRSRSSLDQSRGRLHLVGKVG